MKPASRLWIKGPGAMFGQDFTDRSPARGPAPDNYDNGADRHKLLYTPDEVVRILGLDKGKKDPVKGGRRALCVLVRRTRIRPARIGYSYRYTFDDILSLIEAAKRQ